MQDESIGDDPADTRDASARGYGSEATLWCLHCRRTFLARDARPDPYFGRQGCAYEDCRAAGFGVDIFDESAARAFNDDEEGDDSMEYRDELLGISSGDDVEEIQHFQRLDIEHLARLLAARLIDPDARQNRAPSAVECMEFLCRWPEAKLHGYAVHPAREGDGGAVRLEGLACAIDEVSVERWEPLREAFQKFSGADEFLDDGEQLYAWWD